MRESFILVIPLFRQSLLLPISTEACDAILSLILTQAATAHLANARDAVGLLTAALVKRPALIALGEKALLATSALSSAACMSTALPGLLASSARVRLATLKALECTQGALCSPLSPQIDSAFLPRVFMLRHDSNPDVCASARRIFDAERATVVAGEFALELVAALKLSDSDMRLFAANAIAELLCLHPTSSRDVISQIFKLFVENAGPSVDSVKYEATTDRGVTARLGVAAALAAIAPAIDGEHLPVIFAFLTSRALCDANADVRGAILVAGSKLIDAHGQRQVGVLLPLFDRVLERNEDTHSYDLVKENVVILMGGAAKFLLQEDSRIAIVMKRLVDALRTPSEIVQRSACRCMAQLVPMAKPMAKDLVADLLSRLLTSEKFGERRGAAFGLSGIIKGMGIASLKLFDIMSQLQTAASDKKDDKQRQGAMLAFECLSDTLGRLFEPYVIHILPLLLAGCGDSVPMVREAADGAARAVMAQLSGQGVKLVLPALMVGLEDRSWRTKAASVELLGAMAYCAPKQLSACLPTVVPTLATVLGDSHSRVREMAREAIQQVTNVIRNPEIKELGPILMEALDAPDMKTSSALDTIMATTFINAVDAPSLALLVPVVARGLKERNSEIRKRSARIVANMCSLVADAKDVSPYLPRLLPGVRATLVDPLPDVRAIAATALGSLVVSLDETQFAELLQQLIENLR